MKRRSRIQNIIFKIITFVIVVLVANIVLSEIADWTAYREPVSVDKTEWNAMARRAMKADFSWKNSAREYIRIYNSLL